MLPKNHYTIVQIAELLDVPPDMVRMWEHSGSVTPYRRDGQRLYTDNDLKRLSFVQRLVNSGLNRAVLSDYLALYPCWLRDDCPICLHRPTRENCAKPCWKEKGTFCRVAFDEQEMCKECEFNKGSEDKVIPFAGRSALGARRI